MDKLRAGRNIFIRSITPIVVRCGKDGAAAAGPVAMDATPEPEVRTGRFEFANGGSTF